MTPRPARHLGRRVDPEDRMEDDRRQLGGGLRQALGDPVVGAGPIDAHRALGRDRQRATHLLDPRKLVRHHVGEQLDPALLGAGVDRI